METLSRYKDILVLVVVLFAQFIGLASQIRHPLPNGQDRHNVRLWRYWVVALIAPPEKVLHGVGSGTRGFWSNYLDLRDTRQENQRLLAENNRLHLEQAGLLEDARQGQRLQSLLSFKEQYVYQTEPAEVIGTAGTDQSRIIYINKGSRDGLKPDMPVITPDGIVGRLKDVFPRTAQVMVINDQTSGAGVLLESTRLRGVLRGNVFGQPQIINILPDERIKPGEKVVTSGGDQIFPRGLPVGTVDHVVPDMEHEPYVDVIIKPAANLSHLEEVLVVTEVSDHMPPAAAKDLAKSEAAAAVDAEKERASDILAEKLPGFTDPDALVEANGSQTAPGGDNVSSDAAALLKPIKPLQAVHPDRFSPAVTPPASSLTPGGHVSGPASFAASGGARQADGGDTPKPRPRPRPVNPNTLGEPGTSAGDAPLPKKVTPRRTTPASDAAPGDTVEPPSIAPRAIPARPAPVQPPPSTPQTLLHVPELYIPGDGHVNAIEGGLS